MRKHAFVLKNVIIDAHFQASHRIPFRTLNSDKKTVNNSYMSKQNIVYTSHPHILYYICYNIIIQPDSLNVVHQSLWIVCRAPLEITSFNKQTNN